MKIVFTSNSLRRASRGMLILAGIILLVGLAVACTNGPPEIAATTVPIEPSRAVTQLVNTRQPALTPTPLLATLSPTGIPTLPFCGEESGAAYTFDVVDPFSGEVIQTNNTSEAGVSRILCKSPIYS
jgi:hypothetical protein